MQSRKAAKLRFLDKPHRERREGNATVPLDQRFNNTADPGFICHADIQTCFGLPSQSLATFSRVLVTAEAAWY